MGAGRPTDYKEEYNDLANKFAKLGATDKQMCEFFEVSEVTFNAWKKKYPEFLKSINEGKLTADANVAHALYHRAIGYEHPEDDIRSVNGEIVITPTIKHYPPDSTAALFWLKNRQKEQWRDKTEVEATVDFSFHEVLTKARERAGN